MNRKHLHRPLLAAALWLLAGAGEAAGAGPSDAQAWPRTASHPPARDVPLPAGATCDAHLALDAQQGVLVCRDAGEPGVSLWSVRQVTGDAPPRFVRLLRWRGAAGARLSWHQAPSCPTGAACLQGVLLAEAFDDYCMGTTVLVADPPRPPKVAGRIAELIEVAGDLQCVGATAALAGAEDRIDIVVAEPLLRQTPAGLYVPIDPPVSYRLAKGKLLRVKR